MTAEIKLTTTTQHIRHGSTIGQPLTRRDGELKVTGTARFAADNHPKGMVYAVMVESKIARGRVTSFNIDAAIIFADILTLLEPMGIILEFVKGEGPVIHNPVRDRAASARGGASDRRSP